MTTDLDFLQQLMGEPVEEVTPAEAYSDIWLLINAATGELSPAELALAGKARELADALGAYVRVLLMGSSSHELARQLIAHGADAVCVASDEPTLDGLAAFFGERRPEILLSSDTWWTQAQMPRLAQRLGGSMISHAVDLDIDTVERRLLASHEIYDGEAYQVVACLAHPAIATVQTGVFPVPYEDPHRTGEVEDVALVGELEAVTRKPVELPEASPVPLAQADRIVAGGRGMHDAGWGLVERLARVLGAHVAGSRGAYDEGWIGREQMVDITGVRVAPSLYVACGISGTIQHYAAIEKAWCVVAINRNPDASIFRHADYGIVGDVSDVIPALVDALSSPVGNE
ncbi:MAG TPA: electron transfer flavoprotein subunit alpha/FixB family protein [Anaerolineae bacterium]|nr:electron transfer flavoprotein subunit alpha/FixB family protein [Anaerolineae bacterium]